MTDGIIKHRSSKQPSTWKSANVARIERVNPSQGNDRGSFYCVIAVLDRKGVKQDWLIFALSNATMPGFFFHASNGYR